jgi:hypothetical protein
MIKLVFCACRRPDITPEAFYHYWLNIHGPKVRAVAEKIGARKYIQSHTCEPHINQAFIESRDLQPPYDGITEVWWDDAEALSSGFGSEQGKVISQLLIEDEQNFLDVSRCTAFITREHLIFDL